MTDRVRLTWRYAVIVLAVLFCLYKTTLIFANYAYWDKFSNDFGVYWRVANQPVEQVYFWKGRFPFPYAPTMLLWVQPLSLIPKWPAYFLFIWASAFAYLLAYRRYVPTAVVGLSMIAPQFARGMFTGQVCALMAALLLWACGAKNRILAGIAFGVIASVKPHLVIMAPLLFVLSRDWKAFLAASSTFTLAVILSLILFGPARWPEWVASMAHFHWAVAGTDVIKIAVTPAALAERFGYQPLPFMLGGAVAGSCLVYLSRDQGPLEKAAAVTSGSVLAAPYALSYDLVGIIPLLALAVFRGNIVSAWGMATGFHFVPLFLSLYELMRSRLKELADAVRGRILRRRRV